MSDRERERERSSNIRTIKGKYDKYELHLNRKLGKGGFAAVYMAKKLSTGEVVAIKMIFKRLDYGADEIKLMEKLSKDRENHYTVKILDSYSGGDELCLVLPYYKYGSLRDYISKYGKLDTKIAGNIMLQLISALTYLHKDKSIMHRDLTSANVMIKDVTSDRIDVLLSDFGLAKKFDDAAAKQKHTTCGTPGYSAPEIKKGKYKMGDEVYSLGGILYYMLTGREPNVGKEREQLKNVNDGLAKDLLNQLWQRNPEDRPTLSNMKNCQFLNQYRSSVITQQKPRQRSASRECKHRLYEKGKCWTCGAPEPKSVQPSKDSAYGSTNKASNQPTARATSKERSNQATGRTASKERSNQQNDRIASRNTVENSKKPASRTPSMQSKQTKLRPWPVPPFHHFKHKPGDQLEETVFINQKGRFVIDNSSVPIFEALSDEQYVKYIFELKLRSGKQKITVYTPSNKKQKLPKLADDVIQDRRQITKIFHASELGEFSRYYNFMYKVIEHFYSRNAKITVKYRENGHSKYTAKLMYNGNFRFIFGPNKIFCQEPGTDDGEYYSTKEGLKMDSEERKLFIKTRTRLLGYDKINTELDGKFYEPFIYLRDL